MQLKPIEIVSRIIGPVDPTGQHEVDIGRRRNLADLCTLLDGIMFVISNVARNRNAKEASVRDCGKDAYDFMKGIHETMTDDLEEPPLNKEFEEAAFEVLNSDAVDPRFEDKTVTQAPDGEILKKRLVRLERELAVHLTRQARIKQLIKSR